MPTSLLTRAGLTYHDAIVETGVYSQAISRLPEHMQEARQVRWCVAVGGARCARGARQMGGRPLERPLQLRSSAVLRAGLARADAR